MLHTKFRGNLSTGSREEDFLRVFTIYGRGGHLGHVTHMPRTKIRSPYQRRLHINLALIGQAVYEKMSEHCGRRMTTDAGPWVYYKFTYEPLGQVS